MNQVSIYILSGYNCVSEINLDLKKNSKISDLTSMLSESEAMRSIVFKDPVPIRSIGGALYFLNLYYSGRWRLDCLEF